MKFKRISYVLAVLCLFSGCRKADIVPDPVQSDNAIRFSVKEVDGIKPAKSMIENINDLQTACTPKSMSPFTLNESIGVWADFDYMGTTTKNLLSNVELAYYEKQAGNADNWNYNYGEDEEYWQVGGVYRFRSYYPQQTLRSHIMSTSSATTFVVEYNSEEMQDDIMVSYCEVDTKTVPDLSKPVDLQMHHALSAIQFRLQFKYTDTDKYFDTDSLTGAWMRNTAVDGFCSSAHFGYGTYTDGKYEAATMIWKPSYYPAPGDGVAGRFYRWIYDTGLPFSNTDIEGVDNDPEKEVQQAIAYSVEPTGMGTTYSQNKGWLYIVPQKSTGTAEFCFTTKNGGDGNIFRIKIPAVTGTDSKGPNPEGTEWIPGYRYTYTISITKTNMEVLISVKPWNKYDSSFDIVL